MKPNIKELVELYHTLCNDIINDELLGAGVHFFHVPADELNDYNRDPEKWLKANGIRS